MDEYKEFYNTQYDGCLYATLNDDTKEEHSFLPILKRYTEVYKINSLPHKRCLEIGSGRGFLQDICIDYTGIDYSDSVSAYYHKPFVSCSATELPFSDDSFDIIWSAYVLEHIQGLEDALEEMVRVAKSGGHLILAPAWHCRPWASQGYTVRPYGDFGLAGKLYKFVIPLLESKIVRFCIGFLRRVIYGIRYCFEKKCRY